MQVRHILSLGSEMMLVRHWEAIVCQSVELFMKCWCLACWSVATWSQLPAVVFTRCSPVFLLNMYVERVYYSINNHETEVCGCCKYWLLMSLAVSDLRVWCKHHMEWVLGNNNLRALSQNCPDKCTRRPDVSLQKCSIWVSRWCSSTGSSHDA